MKETPCNDWKVSVKNEFLRSYGNLVPATTTTTTITTGTSTISTVSTLAHNMEVRKAA